MPYKDSEVRKAYAREKARQQRAANPEKYRRHARASRWRNYYGIDLTLDGYDALFAAQRGVCAICQEPDPRRALHVDHDHATGLVRGLLCGNCNRGIGYLRDNLDRIRTAAQYIAQHRQKVA